MKDILFSLVCLLLLTLSYCNQFTVDFSGDIHEINEKQTCDQDMCEATNLHQDSNMSTFIKWLQDNNATFAKVEIRNINRFQRGLFATDSIKKSEVIIRVPRHLLITTTNVDDTPLAFIIRQEPFYSDLSYFFTFYPLFILEEMMDPDSPFKPYLNMLPSTLKHMPSFWSTEDLNLLNGSFIKEKVEHYHSVVQKDYDILKKEFPMLPDFTFEQYMWADNIAGTRKFGVNMDGMYTGALVPFADLLNHNQKSSQTGWSFEESTDSFIISSFQDIEAGEEIFTNYGKSSNSDYLYVYGFSIDSESDREELSNKYPLTLKLDETDALYRKKYAILEKYSKKFVITPDFDLDAVKEMFFFARIAVAKQEDLDLYESENKMKPESSMNPISINNEIAALRYIQEICLGRISKYPTTINEDRKKLKDTKNYPSYSIKKNVVLQLIAEKGVLHYYDELVVKSIEYLELRDWRKITRKIIKESTENPLMYKYFKEVVSTLAYREALRQRIKNKAQ